jgi:two-component system LytT family response regulator
MKLKTIIVEDEPMGQRVLTEILNGYCADSIELVEVAGSVETAISAIRKHQPHLVFLDVILGAHIDGAFDILKAFDHRDFKVVFTTSSQQAETILMAFDKFGAKKYLLKPLIIDEVVESVNFVKEEIRMNSHETDLHHVKSIPNASELPETQNKIPIPARNGVHYIPNDEIVMLRADLNDTIVFLSNCTSIKTSLNLKHFDLLYSGRDFIRVSLSCIINRKHVLRYSDEDGGTIYLTCNWVVKGLLS